MIVEAMGQLHSATQATFALKLARIEISCSQVQRIAKEIGNELAQQRDTKVAQHRRRELPARVSVTPEVVAVEVDGGRLRTRASECGPGVHETQSKENKVACLVTLRSETSERDPTRTAAIISRAASSASPGDSDERVGGGEIPRSSGKRRRERGIAARAATAEKDCGLLRESTSTGAAMRC
jgi:hypothetical protein